MIIVIYRIRFCFVLVWAFSRWSLSRYSSGRTCYNCWSMDCRTRCWSKIGKSEKKKDFLIKLSLRYLFVIYIRVQNLLQNLVLVLLINQKMELFLINPHQIKNHQYQQLLIITLMVLLHKNHRYIFLFIYLMKSR